MTIRKNEQEEAVDIARRFANVGYQIFATKGTARTLNEHGVKAFEIRKLEQDITTLTHLSPFGAVNYIRYAIGYEQYVKEYAAYRHLKEDDLISVLDELQEAAKSQKSIEGWFAHIEEYQQKMKEKQKQRAESAEGVMVSTLHSVKGLEYDKVYLLDVNEGVMPYQKAVLAEAIEEERRMFYVGMTRARKELTLCYVEERFEKKVEPSRFLDEVIQ